MNILAYQIQGILYAVVLQACLCGLALRVKRFPFAVSYLFVFATLSSVLTVSAFYSTWPLVAVVLGVGAILFCKDLAYVKTHLGSLISSKIAWLGMALFFVELSYASFPDYRYDQWNYHLLVGKYLSQVSSFQKPVFYDHVFFTGTTDFWTRIPRLFSSDDVWNQSAANAFSFLAFVIPFTSLVGAIARRLQLNAGLAIFASSALFFSIADHEVLVSSKPDAMLIAFSLGFIFVMFFSNLSPRARWFFAALFISAPISIKLTYLNFSIASTLVVLAMAVTKKIQPDLKGGFFGLLVGLFLGLPFLIKNYFFFGNAIHPIQIAFFESSFWNDNFTNYWAGVSNRAHSLEHYAEILISAPLALVDYNIWFFCMSLVAVVVARKNLKLRSFLSLFVTKFLLALLALFILFWPLFYQGSVAARFVYAAVSVFVLLTLASLSLCKTQKLQILILSMPLLVNSSLEVRFDRMIKSALQSPAEHFSQDRLPHRHFKPSNMINEHRRKAFTKAGYLDATILTDTAMGYFLDAARVDIISPDWSFHYHRVTGKNLEKNALLGCIVRTMNDMNIHYFWRMISPRESLPEWTRDLLHLGESIDEEEQIFFFSEDVMQEALKHPCN